MSVPAPVWEIDPARQIEPLILWIRVLLTVVGAPTPPCSVGMCVGSVAQSPLEAHSQAPLEGPVGEK